MQGFCRIPPRLSTLCEKQKRINGRNLWRARTGALPQRRRSCRADAYLPVHGSEKHRCRTNGGCWPARRFGGMADIRRRPLGYIQRRRSGADRLPQAQRLPPRNPLGQRHAALPSKSAVHRRHGMQTQHAASAGMGFEWMLEKDEDRLQR